MSRELIIDQMVEGFEVLNFQLSGNYSNGSFPHCPTLSLEYALEVYKKESDISLISRYFADIPTTMSKPPVVAALAYDWSVNQNLPIMVFSHEGIDQTSAFSDVEMMKKHEGRIKRTLNISQLPDIVKTITVSVKHNSCKSFFMVTELGDLKVNKQLKRSFSEFSDISRHAIKHSFKINDIDFDPVRNLGLSAGNVGPFPYFINNLDYLFFVKKEQACDFVAIRFTPFDTLIITEPLFELLMVAYLKWKKKEVIFIDNLRQKEPAYMNHTMALS